MKATAQAKEYWMKNTRPRDARPLFPGLLAVAMILVPLAALAAQDEPAAGTAKPPNLLDIAEAEARTRRKSRTPR